METTGTLIAVVYDEGVFKPQGPVPASVKPHQILLLRVPDEDEAPKSRTSLGADLRAIRARIEASGIPLLEKDEILAEIHARRGGYTEPE